MKRQRTKPNAPEVVEVDTDQLEALLRRAEDHAFQEEDYATIGHVLESYVYVTGLLRDKNTAISRLRKLLFGSASEKTRQLTGEGSTDSAEDEAPSPDDGTCEEDTEDATAIDVAEGASPPSRGHGRNSADAYRGAKQVEIAHEALTEGDPCPECEGGKLYEKTPGVLVRIVGQAPLRATVYRLQKLRCHLCGKVFTASAPEDAGGEKYDATAASMIGLLKYGSGLPFNRLQRLQGNCQVPLPASTQWQVLQTAAAELAPAYEELIRQAAQGDVLHNDDTTVKILELMGQPSPKDPQQSDSRERRGMFTSGVVAARDDRRMALFFSGRQHAGENLAEVLKHRADELTAPIQMCDGLSRNLPRELETIVANCLAHARRQFVEIYDRFSDECRYVLEALKVVYHNDAVARKRKLSPDKRLRYHRVKSQQTMDRLQRWLQQQLDERRVEPNSALGGAIAYMLKRWDALTLFLRQPGAPLDNNVCERALKKAILHRKNSLFYKTKHGALVGDLFMSLIYTCELSGANAFDYLTELQRNSDEAAAEPDRWMPWNYRDALTASPAA